MEESLSVQHHLLFALPVVHQDIATTFTDISTTGAPRCSESTYVPTSTLLSLPLPPERQYWDVAVRNGRHAVPAAVARLWDLFAFFARR
eukprot:4953163-Amphidinium_carterae.2